MSRSAGLFSRKQEIADLKAKLAEMEKKQDAAQQRTDCLLYTSILGAGLAGCEAALYLAKNGYEVELYEQKPHKFSPAHKSEGLSLIHI